VRTSEERWNRWKIEEDYVGPGERVRESVLIGDKSFA